MSITSILGRPTPNTILIMGGSWSGGGNFTDDARHAASQHAQTSSPDAQARSLQLCVHATRTTGRQPSHRPATAGSLQLSESRRGALKTVHELVDLLRRVLGEGALREEWARQVLHLRRAI